VRGRYSSIRLCVLSQNLNICFPLFLDLAFLIMACSFFFPPSSGLGRVGPPSYCLSAPRGQHSLALHPILSALEVGAAPCAHGVTSSHAPMPLQVTTLRLAANLFFAAATRAHVASSSTRATSLIGTASALASNAAAHKNVRTSAAALAVNYGTWLSDPTNTGASGAVVLQVLCRSHCLPGLLRPLR